MNKKKYILVILLIMSPLLLFSAFILILNGLDYFEMRHSKIKLIEAKRIIFPVGVIHLYFFSGRFPVGFSGRSHTSLFFFRSESYIFILVIFSLISNIYKNLTPQF
jgi:hypothetical protein